VGGRTRAMDLRMNKVRFIVILPASHVAIVTILLEWERIAPVPRGVELYVSTPRLICHGLNAPGLFVRVLDYYLLEFESRPVWLSRPLFGLRSDDFFFLAGVIAVWYVVGRALDHRRTSRTPGRVVLRQLQCRSVSEL